MKTKLMFPTRLLSVALLLLALESAVQASNQTVTALGDGGLSGQLRAKIAACQSGTSPGGTITFSVVGTITLDPSKGPLPTITTNVTINGAGTITISGADATRIFNVASGATLTLNNITISHGNSDNGDGGALASTGMLNINNSKFFNNATSSSWSGSAILCWGPLNITNCEFGFNTGGGGAVKPRSSGAITTITASNFHDNQSSGSAGGGYGGAMQVFDGPSATVNNCTFTKNSAVHGGAIYVSTNSTLNVNDSTFSGNSGANTGGALDNASTATLSRVTFDRNLASLGGGLSNSGTITVEETTVSGNTAHDGGGIYNTGTLALINTTLSGNSGNNTDGTGGGIRTYGTATLINVTLSGNSAHDGGGILGAATIKNTIIAKGATGANCLGGSGGSFSLSDDNTCGFAAGGGADNVTDLLLGPLANNGGPTLTHLPQPGSRAIDKGTDNGRPATDQRGVKRPQLAGIDVGAVEVVPHVFENTDRAIRYDGWFALGSPNASGNFFESSDRTNDTITYKFNAPSIKWITRKGPEMGKALVTIDGVNKGTFDLYRPSALWNQQILFGGLTSAAHTIIIKVTGTKNASASDFQVALDGFLVGSSTNVVQESALAVQYDKWLGKKQSAASGGSYRINSSVGFATLDFTGTSVSFITARGPSYGKVNVGVDGQFVSTNLDLYAPTQQWQYKVGIKGLVNGLHTIEIDSTHTKNASSSGFGVVLDALEAFPPRQD